MQTQNNEPSVSCGKIVHVIGWYQEEYAFAQRNIFVGRKDGKQIIYIDNQLLIGERDAGLFLNLDSIVRYENGELHPVETLSTSRSYVASDELVSKLLPDAWPETGRAAIGDYLVPEMFSFRRSITGDIEGRSHLEQNLINPMPWIVTSPVPFLTAAQVNTQAEFDRTFCAIVKEESYQSKRVMFISCVNIDISPGPGQLFPMTKCVPWAAYIQDGKGNFHALEHHEIIAMLTEQSIQNSDQINLEDAIRKMETAQEIRSSV